MSYVWSDDQVARYFGYYPGITTRSTYAFLTYATTSEFARSVLPPCLEVCAQPQVMVAVMSFMEVIDGYPNRHGRDRAALISVNARRGDHEGIYYLTVIETDEVNIVTGRELWGMPKQCGSVDYFDDGRSLWGFGERNGHRLIEFEADLGPELGSQQSESETYFELRGYFGPNGQSLSGVQLLRFDLPTVTNRYRELVNPSLRLTGSSFDPGVSTVPVGDFVSGGVMAGRPRTPLLRWLTSTATGMTMRRTSLAASTTTGRTFATPQAGGAAPRSSRQVRRQACRGDMRHPVFRSPAAMPLMVSSNARFTCGSSSPARCRRRSWI